MARRSVCKSSRPAAVCWPVIPKGSRHPHAAALLMDFLLSREGQEILAAAEYLPVRRRIALQDTVVDRAPVQLLRLVLLLVERRL